jgi:aspartate carbamoyltransferase catalytic subunit
MDAVEGSLRAEALQLGAAGALRHLLTLDGLPRATLEQLLARAAAYAAQPTLRHSTLAGRTVANLFFEPSTRTRASFELAAKRLGATTLDLEADRSSAVKGETLEDTLLNLQAMGVDAFVVRHATAGVHARLARVARPGVAIVNAGEANVSHPTQGLLDVLTIRAHKGQDLSRLTVAICGDIRHSRVAASAASALATLGVGELRFVAPPELLPPESAAHRSFEDLESGVAGCDVVMMLRIQRERISSVSVPDDAEYHRRFGLTAARLARAKPDCIVMHPGPVNRGVELASEVMDGPRSVILEQVANGVAVRMAVLAALLGG